MLELNTDLKKAEYLQNLLVSFSTGGQDDNSSYQELRSYFSSDPNTRKLLPKSIITNRDTTQFWQFIKKRFSTYEERRVFIWNDFKSLLEYLESKASNPSEQSITDTLEKFDSNEIHSSWEKALERKTHDPEGAITMARTLIESTCKHILDEIKVKYDSRKIELPALYKKTAKELNLTPEQHDEIIFKQILGSCSGVVNGLGVLRNKLGDAHGTGKNKVKPKERHAELAVNLAGAMALFLIKTYRENAEEKS